MVAESDFVIVGRGDAIYSIRKLQDRDGEINAVVEIDSAIM